MFILVVKLIICANKNIINWSYEYENEKKLFRGHTELNHGPLDLQSNALPLSYTPGIFIQVEMCKLKVEYFYVLLKLRTFLIYDLQ